MKLKNDTFDEEVEVGLNPAFFSPARVCDVLNLDLPAPEEGVDMFTDENGEVTYSEEYTERKEKYETMKDNLKKTPAPEGMSMYDCFAMCLPEILYCFRDGFIYGVSSGILSLVDLNEHEKKHLEKVVSDLAGDVFDAYKKQKESLKEKA